MKKLFTIICALFLINNANAQLLYKISGKGLDKPSYIVGTYHLAPASFVESIPGANRILVSVDQVCGEVDMNEINTTENMQKMMEAMMLPEGQSLSDILTSEEMDKLNAYLRKILGVDLTNPMIAEQMGKMTPMSLSTTLQLMTHIKETPGFNPAALIDDYFQKEAIKKGKPIIGIETVDFQIQILYKSSTLNRQKEDLFCSIDKEEEYSKLIKEMKEAYFAQNIEELQALMEQEYDIACGDIEETEKEMELVLYGRNEDWIKKMPAIMSEKSTLFVVGAGHLPGDRGVLKLLKDNGYKVKAVKK